MLFPTFFNRKKLPFFTPLSLCYYKITKKKDKDNHKLRSHAVELKHGGTTTLSY
jgi:hypothetical protein